MLEGQRVETEMSTANAEEHVIAHGPLGHAVDG